MMTNPAIVSAPKAVSRPLFYRFFVILALLQLPLALYLYSQWQGSQQHNLQLARQLEQQQRSQQQQLQRIGQRLGQLQADLGQLSAVGQRLVTDYDLSDEISLQRLDPNLLKRPFNGFAELHQGLAQLSEQSREYGMTLAALESLLLNLHINEITQIQGHPVPDGTTRLSSGFGPRRDPFTGRARWHKGVDFSGKLGQPIAATAAGVVSTVDHHPAFGGLVEINHGQGWVTRYAHVDTKLVEVGDYVEKGQHIALMGRTGRATGVHLHYEVLKGNKQLDPARFLPN
ncbi:M23 family metallopeptidase [Zobellella iuensis]|uniref:M23 family metallopeptidase n=1 Tax=Zobellella iuensis TaxID=2803811 RepID=A0ABS1QQI4_9GAMM|nr:M23 family metallopeptidase [Zobellella iuensis]MBL1376772.1 M23 family metallopeptidase [Zobellella iuensis]